MKTLAILTGLLVGISANAAREDLRGVRLKSCVEQHCVLIEAPHAQRGYMAKFFVLEGPLKLTETSAKAAPVVNLAQDAFLDLARGAVLFHRPAGDIYIDLNTMKITRLHPSI